MADSWKITARGRKRTIQAALLAQDENDDWHPDIVLSGREVAEDRPQDWVLEAWLPRKPGKADTKAIAALFARNPPELTVEKLPPQDWLTLSQQGVEPIRAGRFYIHTPDFPPSDRIGAIDLAIPASQAFGTGQHETTAGCLALLDTMKRRGTVVRNIADIGTGTGLLAFAAMRLWPLAKATASDIDPVCIGVVEDNAAMNGIRMGSGAGELTMTIADGVNNPLLQTREPYDLLLANILAGPLVGLSRDFACSVVPGGHVLLAGLLQAQERAVRRAYRHAGFHLVGRLVNGDWPILWLRRRRTE